MSISRHRNTIGGARITPSSSNAGGIWNLGEAAMYNSFYSSTVPSWPRNEITRGLLAYWDAATQELYLGGWTDKTGTYNGTIIGPTFSSNNGNGFVFDGINDYIQTDYTANTGNNFTVGVWCKPTAVGVAAGTDIAVKGYSTISQPFASYGIDYLNTSKFRYGVANNLTFATVTGTTTSSINNFYYVVLTFGGDTSDKTIRGYVNINGIMTLDASSTIANNPAYNTQPFYMGGYIDYFTGSIFGCHIYNVALTASEIQQNFDTMRGRFSL
jgi:hypothetical protein